jgi:hypothetical protein
MKLYSAELTNSLHEHSAFFLNIFILNIYKNISLINTVVLKRTSVIVFNSMNLVQGTNA